MRKEKIDELNSYINELKTIKNKVLNESPKFLHIEVNNYLLNNGKILRREKLIKGKNGNSVIILPVTEEGNVITIVEARPTTSDEVVIGFPAGYIEKNEEPIVAAERELLEETGYKSDNLIQVAKYYQDEGIGSATGYCFLAKDAVKVAEQHLDGSEELRYMTFNIDEIYELYEENRIMGAGSQVTLSRSKKYLY